MRKFTIKAMSLWSAFRRAAAKVMWALSPVKAQPVTLETNNSGARGSSSSCGDVMVECSYTFGVKKSTDGGKTWRTVMTAEELQLRINPPKHVQPRNDQPSNDQVNTYNLGLGNIKLGGTS